MSLLRKITPTLRGSAAIAVVSAMSFSPSLNAGESDLSYHMLAAESITEPFIGLLDELDSLDKKVMPHETKALRKRIGMVRLNLDLFAYAYGNDPRRSKKDDVWAEIREELDDGYETMGAFKDIFDETGQSLAVRDELTGKWGPGVKAKDVEYPKGSKKEIKAARKKLLSWVDSFLDEVEDEGYVRYLSKAPYRGEKKERFAKREKSDLSRFFWGGVDSEPKKRKSGIENLMVLVEEQLEEAAKTFEPLIEEKTLLEYEAEEMFHDFRKRVRSGLKVLGAYSAEFDDAKEVERLTLLFTEMVDRFGALNDIFLKLRKAERDEDHRKAGKIEKKIDKGWKNLKKWMKKNDVEDELEEFADAVR